jgi:hypothetical protein
MVKEGRLDALRGENFQNLVAVARQRPVIEGQHHLMIFERQRFGILHGADAGMLAGIDHQGSRGAERIGMAGAIGGRRRPVRRYQASKPQAQFKAAHCPMPNASPTRLPIMKHRLHLHLRAR